MKRIFSSSSSSVSGMVVRSGVLLSIAGMLLLVFAAFAATEIESAPVLHGVWGAVEAPVLCSAELETGAHAEVSVVSSASLRHAIGSQSFRRTPVRKVLLLLECILLAPESGVSAGAYAASEDASFAAFRYQALLKTVLPVRAGPLAA